MLEARRPWQPERASSARAREPPAPEGPFSATKPFGELSRAATHLSALFARSDEQAPELPKYHDASATSTDAGPGVYALSCSQAARGNKFTGRELEVQCAYVPFLGDVDAHHSSFAARIDLDLTWAASEEDLRLAKEDPRGYAPGFVPDIVIKNAQTVETLFVAGKSGNVHQIQDGTKNFMRVRFEGTFVEEYSFAAFPFDVQTLTFVLGLSFYNSDELRFVLPPEKKGPFFYLLTRHSALPEWTPMRLLAGTHIVEGFSELLCKVQVCISVQCQS
ncbi:hypothetical protein T492DRAFT_53922 [Pavlovales sp. CCMP2436]|nr:hypothetical protein T492DRAFT_53922 [Pavlovales sp. CCMP2436]